MTRKIYLRSLAGIVICAFLTTDIFIIALLTRLISMDRDLLTIVCFYLPLAALACGFVGIGANLMHRSRHAHNVAGRVLPLILLTAAWAAFSYLPIAYNKFTQVYYYDESILPWVVVALAAGATILGMVFAEKLVNPAPRVPLPKRPWYASRPNLLTGVYLVAIGPAVALLTVIGIVVLDPQSGESGWGLVALPVLTAPIAYLLIIVLDGINVGFGWWWILLSYAVILPFLPNFFPAFAVVQFVFLIGLLTTGCSFLGAAIRAFRQRRLLRQEAPSQVQYSEYPTFA